MVRAHISSDEPRHLVLRTHARSFHHAVQVVEKLAPTGSTAGYRLEYAMIRRQSAGRRVSLTVILMHTDRRIAPYTPEAAVEHFQFIEDLAQRRDS